jgi:hypothetical protein
MNRASVISLATAAVWLLAAGLPARAAPLPSWAFTSTSSASSFGPSDATVLEVGNHGNPRGSGDITGGSFYTFGTSNTPVALKPTSFTETVWITDRASNESAPVKFDLTLSGSVSSSGSWLGVTPDGATSQTVHLGHYYYTVNLEPFQAPEDAGGFGGRVVFDVTVRHNPEPSSLVLAGAGLPLLGLARWHRRRRAAAASA